LLIASYKMNKSSKLKCLSYISVLLILIACLSDLDAQVIQTTYEFKHFSPTHSSLKPDLNSKCQKLNTDDYTFVKSKYGKIIKSTSRVYKAILDKPDLCFRQYCFSISDTLSFEKSIHQVYYVKGKIYFGENKKAFQELAIEEVIFYSEEDAKSLFNYIQEVRRIEYFWNSLDKSPSYIFRESNKLYFVKRNVNIIKMKKNGFSKKIADLLMTHPTVHVRHFSCEIF